MSKPYVVILDEYGYYANAVNFSGRKRSIAKQMQIQERWDARCQKRRLRNAIDSGQAAEPRKI